MDVMTNFVHRMLDEFTWDFYRIELFTHSEDYKDLIDYLRTNELDYVEHVEFASSIIVFRVLRDHDGASRAEIFEKFGDHPYFAMEGNMRLSESALYGLYRQIQEKNG